MASRTRSRSTPPKPLVGIRAVERLLLWQIEVLTPEVRLVVAVITQAIADCAKFGSAQRADAQRFMRGDRLNLWSEVVGLNPEFVRDVATKTRYVCPQTASRRVRSKPASERTQTKTNHPEYERSSNARLQ